VKKAAGAGALIATCVAVGCGGDAAPAAQGAAEQNQETSACDLLTAEEIQEVTGLEPGEGISRALGSGFLECRWMVADGSDQLAYVAYRPAGAPLSYAAWVEEYKASAGDDFDESMLEDYELISEVGDQFALYADGGSLGGLFQMYTGGRAVIVGTMSIAGRSNQVLAMSLAAKATPRLP
jgi:hypothetical protein